jgi:hypothetical protein
MKVAIKPLSEVTKRAVDVLSEEIGIADTVRFLNQFTTGYGDYTRERAALVDHLTLEEIVAAIERARHSRVPGKRPKRGAAGARRLVTRH